MYTTYAVIAIKRTSPTALETLLTADQYTQLAENLYKHGQLTGENLDCSAEFAEFLQEEGGAHLLGSPYKNKNN